MKTLKKVWAYARIVFEIVTRNSYRLMFNLSLKHLNALKTKAGDTFFDARIAYYEPKHNSYATLFEAWKVNLSTQQGGTQKFNDYIELLRTDKMEDWDIAIQVVYKQRTTEYKSILPQKRKPFITGAFGLRVTAVKTLSEVLVDYPALATVKASIDDFYSLLSDAQNAQQQGKTSTTTSSGDIEPARIVCAKGMMVNLGYLIANFADANIADVENYFDVAAIQSHHQTDFTGTVKALLSKLIAKRKLLPDDMISIENTGLIPFLIFFADNKNAEVPNDPPILAPGVRKEVKASDLKYSDSKPYLIVANLDANMTATYKIVLP